MKLEKEIRTRKETSSNLSQTSKKYLENNSSEIGLPFILILSLTATKCGDVNKPILILCEDVDVVEVEEVVEEVEIVFNKFEVKAEVEPFPFVPVICITFNLFKSVGYNHHE